VTEVRRWRELLLACAVWDASEAELGRVRAAAAVIEDWDAVIHRLRMHRIVPHAHRALTAAGAAVPEHASRAIAEETRSIAARALGRARQLAELARRLHDAGVRSFAFKGPALSLAAYGDVGVRDSIDLDIVVRPRELDRARAVMLAAGYVSRSEMSAAQERMLQRSFGHFSYMRADEPAGVELHWRFAAPRYPWSMPPDDVLARSGTITLAGAVVTVADATDEVLLQAMHGTRHQWERIEWLLVFARLVRGAKVDASALLERARSNGSERALGVALRLSMDLLGAALPPTLAAVATGRPAGKRAAAIGRGIEREIRSGASSLAQPYALNLRTMDRAGDRARYLALSVFSPTPREWELVRLPDALLFLYYPIRALRVLGLRLRSIFARR
jgi:hypothetical protein